MTSDDSLPPSPTIISFVKDLPNICSLAGLLAAMVAIYAALVGTFPVAIIALAWAVFFDWSDGIIARKLPHRTEVQREFGGQIDSLIDIVSFAVCPAVILLSYGEFNIWFLPGAFCIVAAGALRLSYFNVFGLVGDDEYQGLAIDNNGLVLISLFLLEGQFSADVFTALLYGSVVILALLNVAPIRTPKLDGHWYVGVTGYIILVTAFNSWLLVTGNS